MMPKKINLAYFFVCFSFTILINFLVLQDSCFGFSQPSNLLNGTNATATNSTQVSTVQITTPDTRSPTDGNSLDIDLQIQPFPVTKNIETQFMIKFLQPSSNTVQVHVDYDFAISNMNNEVYSASLKTGQPLLHTAEGIVKIPYKFMQEGEYSLEISVMGINFIPIKTEKAVFNLNVS